MVEEAYEKKPLLVHMPRYVHELLSWVAEEKDASMASVAREAIWAAIEIHVEERKRLPTAVEGWWRARNPEDVRLGKGGRRAAKPKRALSRLWGR